MIFDIPNRSQQPEMMDLRDGTIGDFERNFNEIEAVNRWLGGIRLSKTGLLSMMEPGFRDPIVDIGCGSGDVLRALARDRRFNAAELIGIDNDPMFLHFARERSQGARTRFEHGNILKGARHIPDGGIYMFNMMLHHFPEDEIVMTLRHFHARSTVGLFINDLHRNRIAQGFIWLMARAFGTSRQFRNDAPLSVCKGFTRADWEHILKRCGFRRFSIQWDPGFRHVIRIFKDDFNG